ncbi:MAG: hypothetical protein SYC29_15990 [Planctomycetota bacterium]|nr:hypothetical protein [Planctomycetota bacterium]
MRPTMTRTAMIGLIILGVLSVVTRSVVAQEYEVLWQTIDGGGGTSAGGAFQLSGTIGQADAGATMTAGDFVLTGGFWSGSEASANPCPADFDGDGDVDTGDLLHLLGCWGTPCGDVDGDSDTDTTDLLALLAAWGDCP